MAAPYEPTALRGALSQWRGDQDGAVFDYVPVRTGGDNEATQLILDVKRRMGTAIQVASEWAAEWIRSNEQFVRGSHERRLIICVPRSAAGLPNVGCERIADRLAESFDWLDHAPHALRRIATVPPAHRGPRGDAAEHERTMQYVGPALRAEPFEGLRCVTCAAIFVDPEWLRRHASSARHRLNAAATPALATPVLLLDDVLTTGETSRGAKRVLASAGADNVVGLYLGRTVLTPPLSNRPANNWGFLLDLDDTLVLTHSLLQLRDAGRWTEAMNSFGATEVPPETRESVSVLHQVGLAGVVTRAPRDYAEQLLAHHGIRLPVLVAYQESERAKPHPSSFSKAAARLGVAPSRCIVIGDDWRDLAGARAAGMRAIGITWNGSLASHVEAQHALAICRNWASVLDAVAAVTRA